MRNTARHTDPWLLCASAANLGWESREVQRRKVVLLCILSCRPEDIFASLFFVHLWISFIACSPDAFMSLAWKSRFRFLLEFALFFSTAGISSRRFLSIYIVATNLLDRLHISTPAVCAFLKSLPVFDMLEKRETALIFRIFVFSFCITLYSHMRVFLEKHANLYV